MWASNSTTILFALIKCGPGMLAWLYHVTPFFIVDYGGGVHCTFFRNLGSPRLRFPTVGITMYLCNNESDLKCPIIIIQHEFLFLEHGLSDVDPHNVIVYNPFPWSPTITFLTLAALPHKTCFLTIRTVSFYTSCQNLLPKNVSQPFGGSLRFFYKFQTGF